MYSQDQNNGNRRRAGRVECSTRCWCENPGVIQYVHLANVSEGGMFIRTQSPFQVGETVRVRWEFPDMPHEFEATMQVMWKSEGGQGRHREPGMGLKFLSLCEPVPAALGRFIYSNGCGEA
jgi:uncharacterized protein (TIGR02266 family)